VDIVSLSSQDNFKKLFQVINRLVIFLWRLGLGRMMNAWPDVLGRYLILTHTGRKTRMTRHTPLNYAIVSGEIHCTAGFGASSDWYRNLKVNPYVEVWLPDSWWSGTAEEVVDPQRKNIILRQVLINSGFASRLAGYDPTRMSEPELTRLAEQYPVIRIRRIAARTGQGGPGDLAWIWPVTTFLLLPALLLPLLGRKRYPRP
jgi:deazaflavin-dependent oxidoreductase (nitroreductase family)